MKFRLQLAFAVLMAGACLGQVVDRMAAVVNKRVIMESELDQAVRIEFLMQGKPLDKITQAEKLAVLDRLIDRSLLEQQIVTTDALNPTSEELASRVAEIRKQTPEAQTDDGWSKVLAGYGLTEQDIRDSITSEVRILRFIDLRFRGLVRVDRNAVETYYREKFVPQLRAEGAAEPPLSAVSDKIENILVEQNIDEMLARWLETLRGQSHIEKMNSAAAPSAPEGAHP